MQKKLSSLLAAALLLSALALPALAAKPGDVVTISIPYFCGKPWGMVATTYNFSEGLEFVNAYGLAEMEIEFSNSINFLGYHLSDATSSSVMLQVKVKDGANPIEKVNVTQIFTMWIDDQEKPKSYHGVPSEHEIIVDAPTRGALPETEKPPVPLLFSLQVRLEKFS
ncbi:MAG: hypothetical protein ACOX7B_03545 [Christensenellales bacterium]|jgi:hypothetical protein